MLCWSTFAVYCLRIEPVSAIMAVIGIDYTPAYEQGAGIGRYVRELISGLASVDAETEYRLFVAGCGASRPLPPAPGDNFHWCTTRVSPTWLTRIWHRLRIPWPVEKWTGDVDLFHATDFVLPPTRPGTRTLLTVHDLSFVHLPEATSPALKRYLDRMVPRSVRLADHVLADSQATKDDLVALYHTPPEKVTVLLSGVSRSFQRVIDRGKLQEVRRRYDLEDWPFLFTVGTVQPRKNYARLVEALARVRRQWPDLHLVIAGGRGWLEDPIYAAVSRLKLEAGVHFIGFARDEDLSALYSAAVAVPYVSLYEGFGLPVLEAMACGTPVIASNISSIPEVAGEAALLVDPLNVEAIADAIERVMSSSSLAAQLVERGYAQVAEFTWERAADRLTQVYASLLAG